ncbi:hypothetical protein D3C80_1742490 [compost metagenome]
MNPLKVNALVATLTEGTAIENRRYLLASVMGCAAATLVNLPSSPLQDSAVRDYYTQNVSEVRSTMYQINEVAPFDVDRAVEYGFQLWSRRYQLVYGCCIDELVGEAPFAATLIKVMPEYAESGVTKYKITQAVNILKADAEAAA